MAMNRNKHSSKASHKDTETRRNRGFLILAAQEGPHNKESRSCPLSFFPRFLLAQQAGGVYNSP